MCFCHLVICHTGRQLKSTESNHEARKIRIGEMNIQLMNGAIHLKLK